MSIHKKIAIIATSLAVGIGAVVAGSAPAMASDFSPRQTSVAAAATGPVEPGAPCGFLFLTQEYNNCGSSGRWVTFNWYDSVMNDFGSDMFCVPPGNTKNIEATYVGFGRWVTSVNDYSDRACSDY